MKEVTQLLNRLETHIKDGTFEQLESDKIEIKSLADGTDWTELYKSVCAFLNTEGGIVLIGIKEKDKKYAFSGFKGAQAEEDKIRAMHSVFTNEQGQILDLKDQFPNAEYIDFMGGRVCAIYVEKLSEEKKYVFYKSNAYRRRLTGDEKLVNKEIIAHNEYKKDLVFAQELLPVKGANLDSLDVDKLNDYIIRLNRESRVETLKADIPAAKSFLSRKLMIKEDVPTLLGILVCGKNIYDSISGRCQVDCYVDSVIQVAQNKQVIKDNIFQLMESAVGFVYKNIQVGVGYEKGGSQMPEYPENLIRETVNNALVHRDYKNDGFVNIIIKPNKSIEIRNPGNFQQNQLLQFTESKTNFTIKRIVPIAKASNPRLADILKTYDRWEGRGIGMSSLTNACLDNLIDVPYYFLTPDKISLIIPKGRIIDNSIDFWFDSFEGYIYQKNGKNRLSEEEKIVLAYFYKSEKLNRNERYTVQMTPDNNHFNVISNLEDCGLIFKIEQQNTIFPIYVIDRTLFKSNFHSELIDFYGKPYELLSTDNRDILNLVWTFHHFGNPTRIVNASFIASYLYAQKNSIINGKDFETFGRRIRNMVNKLEELHFLAKKKGEKLNYMPNLDFKNSQLSKSGIA